MEKTIFNKKGAFTMEDDYQLGIYNSYKLKEGVDVDELTAFLESKSVPKSYYSRHIEYNEFSGFFRNTEFTHLKYLLVGKYLKILTYQNGQLLKKTCLPDYLKKYY